MTVLIFKFLELYTQIWTDFIVLLFKKPPPQQRISDILFLFWDASSLCVWQKKAPLVSRQCDREWCWLGSPVLICSATEAGSYSKPVFCTLFLQCPWLSSQLNRYVVGLFLRRCKQTSIFQLDYGWHTKDTIPSKPSMVNPWVHLGLLTGAGVTQRQPYHPQPLPSVWDTAQEQLLPWSSLPVFKSLLPQQLFAI